MKNSYPLTISRHIEQFMENENKTELNELTTRSSTTDVDHYLHSSIPIGKYNCWSNIFMWEKYFSLNNTELVWVSHRCLVIFKWERYFLAPRLKRLKTVECNSNSPKNILTQGERKFREGKWGDVVSEESENVSNPSQTQTRVALRSFSRARNDSRKYDRRGRD